jgi:hypothetical protein
MGRVVASATGSLVVPGQHYPSRDPLSAEGRGRWRDGPARVPKLLRVDGYVADCDRRSP